MLSIGSGGTRFCSDASSSAMSGGTKSTRVAAICPELDVHAPGFFEDAPEPHADWIAGLLGAAAR